MIKDFPGEKWKTVKFDFDFTNDFRLEVSNFGRLRTFNKISDGNLINGSMINGYRIVRLKLYHPREENIQAKLDNLQQQVFKLARKLKSQRISGESNEVIDETAALLDAFKKKVSKKFQDDLKERTINYQSLIHRIVADYFLPKPKVDQILVAHLDYDKLNNRASNLKWMSREENYTHQKGSPHVIEDKKKIIAELRNMIIPDLPKILEYADTLYSRRYDVKIRKHKKQLRPLRIHSAIGYSFLKPRNISSPMTFIVIAWNRPMVIRIHHITTTRRLMNFFIWNLQVCWEQKQIDKGQYNVYYTIIIHICQGINL